MRVLLKAKPNEKHGPWALWQMQKPLASVSLHGGGIHNGTMVERASLLGTIPVAHGEAGRAMQMGKFIFGGLCVPCGTLTFFNASTSLKWEPSAWLNSCNVKGICNFSPILLVFEFQKEISNNHALSFDNLLWEIKSKERIQKQERRKEPKSAILENGKINTIEYYTTLKNQEVWGTYTNL